MHAIFGCLTTPRGCLTPHAEEPVSLAKCAEAEQFPFISLYPSMVIAHRPVPFLLSSPSLETPCASAFRCNEPVLCASENKNANSAKALEAANAILKASQYRARTAFSRSGESSCRANTDLRNFSMSWRQHQQLNDE